MVRKLQTNGLERSFKRCLNSIHPFKVLGKSNILLYKIESIELKFLIYQNLSDLKFLEYLLS